MKRLAVESIIIPLEEGLPSEPSVAPRDRITDAIEVMLKSDLKRIAVTEGSRAVGMITLEDALRKVGLEGDLKSKGTRTFIFQGRTFNVDK